MHSQTRNICLMHVINCLSTDICVGCSMVQNISFVIKLFSGNLSLASLTVHFICKYHSILAAVNCFKCKNMCYLHTLRMRLDTIKHPQAVFNKVGKYQVFQASLLENWKNLIPQVYFVIGLETINSANVVSLCHPLLCLWPWNTYISHIDISTLLSSYCQQKGFLFM